MKRSDEMQRKRRKNKRSAVCNSFFRSVERLSLRSVAATSGERYECSIPNEIRSRFRKPTKSKMTSNTRFLFVGMNYTLRASQWISLFGIFSQRTNQKKKRPKKKLKNWRRQNERTEMQWWAQREKKKWNKLKTIKAFNFLVFVVS